MKKQPTASQIVAGLVSAKIPFHHKNGEIVITADTDEKMVDLVQFIKDKNLGFDHMKSEPKQHTFKMFLDGAFKKKSDVTETTHLSTKSI